MVKTITTVRICCEYLLLSIIAGIHIFCWKVWTNFDNARWCGVRDSAHEKLHTLLLDAVPEASCQFKLNNSIFNTTAYKCDYRVKHLN